MLTAYIGAVSPVEHPHELSLRAQSERGGSLHFEFVTFRPTVVLFGRLGGLDKDFEKGWMAGIQ